MIAWEQGEGMLRRTTVEDKAVQTEPGMFSPSADGGTADADRHGAQGPPTVAPRRLIPRPPTVAPPTPADGGTINDDRHGAHGTAQQVPNTTPADGGTMDADRHGAQGCAEWSRVAASGL